MLPRTNQVQVVVCAWLVGTVLPSGLPGTIDPATTLDCHRRDYTYKAVKADSLGRRCWDYVTVMSCWGRCDSYEIADWKFPYKKSFHPACMHDKKDLRETKLSHCDPDVETGTDVYEYFEAITCTCQICRSSKASCQGLLYHTTTRLP